VLLVAIIICQASIKTVIWVHFQINRPDIVRRLCQSRNQIQNRCQGKCHLKAMLTPKKSKEDDLAFPGYSLIKNLEILFTLQTPCLEYSLFLWNFTKERLGFSALNWFEQETHTKILKPPTLA
jgi:hypothetical protein